MAEKLIALNTLQPESTYNAIELEARKEEKRRKKAGKSKRVTKGSVTRTRLKRDIELYPYK